MTKIFETGMTAVYVNSSGEVFVKNKQHPKSEVRISDSPAGIISISCVLGTLVPGTHAGVSCIKAYPGHIKCD